MNKNKLMGVIILCILTALTIATLLSPPSTLEESEALGKQAKFVFSNLTVTPEQVEPREVVAITLQVQNIGEKEGNHTLELLIDGLVEEIENVNLGSGETISVTFFIEKEEESSYNIDLGGLTGAFRVVEPEAPSETIGEAYIYFFDVGQADAALFLGSDFTVLIDAGDYRSNDVVPLLKSVGVKQIDLLIGTHPHADHIGQFPQVFEAFPVKEVWLSGDTHTTRTFERAVDAILASSATYHEPRAGEVFQFGSLIIEVLNPAQLTGVLHEGSISVRITFGRVSFVLTGDAETPTEQAIVDRGYNLKAQVLQLGHHGSSTSSSSVFLEAVFPEVVIYSAGKDNSYGHPHSEVVDRLADMGILLYGTDVHGTVLVITDGVTYNVETLREIY